jgi:hypothetical protein
VTTKDQQDPPGEQTDLDQVASIQTVKPCALDASDLAENRVATPFCLDPETV